VCACVCVCMHVYACQVPHSGCLSRANVPAWASTASSESSSSSDSNNIHGAWAGLPCSAGIAAGCRSCAGGWRRAVALSLNPSFQLVELQEPARGMESKRPINCRRWLVLDHPRVCCPCHPPRSHALRPLHQPIDRATLILGLGRDNDNDLPS